MHRNSSRPDPTLSHILDPSDINAGVAAAKFIDRVGAGSRIVKMNRYDGRFLRGNSALLKKNIGKTRKLTINWKSSTLSMFEPIISPRLTSADAKMNVKTKEKSTTISCGA
jgi:hypothetical protein